MSPIPTPVGPTVVGVLPPPPGVVPNFVNPSSLATVIWPVGIFCLVLTIVTTSIRFVTKFYIVKAHGWADCM